MRPIGSKHRNAWDRIVNMHKRRATISLAFLAAGVLGCALWSFVGGPLPVSAGTSPGGGPDAPTCGPNWLVVSSPNVGVGSNYLLSVDANASGDVWAVGHYYDAGAARYKTLIEQRNGSQWNIVSSPNATGHSYLTGVSTLSSTNAWAVGRYYDQANSRYRTLLEFWNGSQWSALLGPNTGIHSNYLNGVAVVAANDAWAVGDWYDGATAANRTLILHWNGTAWSAANSPNTGAGDNVLTSVTAVAANDVWAVGTYNNGTADRTLALHWNGSTWSTVSTPNANGSTSDNRLMSVTAVAANDVWAVGRYYDIALGKDHTLILHWNGTAWSIATSQNASASNNVLNGVEKVSSNNVWAVGNYYDLNVSAYRTLIEHWNGTAWSVIVSPNTGTSFNDLYSVAVVAPSDVWAVGNYDGGTDDRTLTERYNPCTGTATPTNEPRQTDTATPTSTYTPTAPPTQTPGGPSATSIPSNTSTRTSTNMPTSTVTSTPSVTPTVCVMTFSDVHPLDWYYVYVEWVYCHGITFGYNTAPPCETAGTPCFKPGNFATRGQMAKFVSIAAGYNDVVFSQTFVDVPVGSTFWEYIERDYLHGVVEGYTSPPPCTSTYPCFRPGEYVTRGQMAKVISSAAGYHDQIPPNQQTFDDVPHGSTFWLYIERAYAHGVVSGYVDSLFFHFCVDAGVGSPCFLPGNNVTRAQLAKMIYLSLGPGTGFDAEGVIPPGYPDKRLEP